MDGWLVQVSSTVSSAGILQLLNVLPDLVLATGRKGMMWVTVSAALEGVQQSFHCYQPSCPSQAMASLPSHGEGERKLPVESLSLLQPQHREESPHPKAGTPWWGMAAPGTQHWGSCFSSSPAAMALLVPTWKPCFPLHHEVSSFGGMSMTDTMSPTCKRLTSISHSQEESTAPITTVSGLQKTAKHCSGCTSAFAKPSCEVEEFLDYPAHRIQLLLKKRTWKAAGSWLQGSG